MADSKALYQEVILDHNKKPRNYGAVEAATHRAEGHNPLCGDHLTLTLKVEGDKLDAIGRVLRHLQSFRIHDDRCRQRQGARRG